MKKHKTQDAPKLDPDQKPLEKGDFLGAVEKYAAENQEIMLAIEAMRRSQLVPEEKVSQLIKEQPYLIGY